MRSWLLALGAAALHASAAYAQHGFWQPDDRVLITSFVNARSIATDQRYVFVATTAGLEIYDQTFRRWLPPSTIEDGYPAMERPARIAYDAREGGLWLLTELQTLYTYQHAFQRWQQRFPGDLPEDMRAAMLNRTSQRDPALQIMRNVAGRDRAGRAWQVTDIVPAERNGTYWATSFGGNFAFVDTRNLSSEAYTFGTLSYGVSALVADRDGRIWFGGDGAGPRNGIASADRSLQNWQHFEAGVTDAPAGRIHEFSVSTLGLHAATPDGVYAHREAGWHRVTDGDARALAHTAGKLWIGGRGPLGWLDGADQFHRVEFPLQTVHALAARQDTLWIGAEAGLFRWTEAGARQVATGTPIRAVAVSPQAVITITPAGVRTWDGTQLGLPLRNAALDRVGEPVTLAVHEARVFVGGRRGVAAWNTEDDSWRYLTIPDDIPEGPILDVMADGPYVWVATPAGALRLEWN